MNPELFYALAGTALFSMGLYALLMHRHLLRRILAINVMGSGVFLVLAALTARNGGGLPDPVPHAMIITGIVVSVAATALALVLILKLTTESGYAILPDERQDKP